MRKHRRLRLYMGLLAGILLLPGCLHARSPDEYGYALVIGIDEGEDKAFYVSMLLQRSSGDTGGDAQCELTAIECDDLFEAVALLESGLPFALNLSRTSAIVCSADVAKTGKLEEFLSVSLSALHIRHYANLLIAHGRAEAYLDGLQSELNPNIAKLQYNFIAYGEKTGLVPAITLAQFFDRAWSGSGDVLLALFYSRRF